MRQISHNAYQTQQGIGINFSGFNITLKTPAPSILGETFLTPNFEKTGTQERSIGNLSGTCETQVSETNGIQLTRSFFQSGKTHHCAIRLAIHNQRETPIYLNQLIPFSIEGMQGLNPKCGDFQHLRFVKTARLKTDVPGAFDFKNDDENYFDASLEGERIKAGGGVTGRAEDYLNLESVRSEPYLYIIDKQSPQKDGVFFGVIGQSKHLTSISVAPTTDKSTLKSINCICEFDGIEIDSGESIDTHWILIAPITDEPAIAREYAEIVAAELHCPKPKNDPLNIYCSWQFYGFDFNSRDLAENLAELKKRPVPIDVVQLDNCWIDKMGDWNANHNFPEGMPYAAELIRNAGFTPGIWTCPTVIQKDSLFVQQHPDVIALNNEGQEIPFNSATPNTRSIDPTHPIFEEYITKLYQKLKDWGYTYHKIDHIRSICVHDGIRFYDRKVNRAMAYQKMLQLVKKAIGDDCYLLACGGINDGGNIGSADALRTSNDMFGFWDSPDGERWKGTLIKLKQNTVRNYTNRFWHADPDACPLRRRDTYFRPDVIRADLSLGLFTDEEAFSIAAVQYLTGGNTCICERFAELDEDRRQLMSHFIPSIGVPCDTLNYDEKKCPNHFLTKVTPKDDTLEPWWTLAVGNWESESRTIDIDLSTLKLGDPNQTFTAFEFKEKTFMGVVTETDILRLTIPSHGMRIIRLAPWNGTAQIAGTNLHFSGGGAELSDIKIEADKISGTVTTQWDYPVTIYAAFESKDNGVSIHSVTVPPTQKHFTIDRQS